MSNDTKRMKQVRLHLTLDEAWRLLEWLDATVQAAPDGEDVSLIVAINSRVARLLKKPYKSEAS